MGVKRPKSLLIWNKKINLKQDITCSAKESEAKKIKNTVDIHFTNDDFKILMFNKIIIFIHL